MSPEHNTLRLKQDETAIAGYGSLLSITSITKMLGREYQGPFIKCHVTGWRRSWNVAMPNKAFYYVEAETRIYPKNILYLNVRPDPKSWVNCALFVVKQDELETIHDREWIYDPVNVIMNLIGARVEGGQVVLYSGRNEHLIQPAKSPRDVAIRASYLRILENALHNVNSGFRIDFEDTTDPVPKHLVVEDLLDPNRPNPWASAGRSYRPDVDLGQ